MTKLDKKLEKKNAFKYASSNVYKIMEIVILRISLKESHIKCIYICIIRPSSAFLTFGYKILKSTLFPDIYKHVCISIRLHTNIFQ